MKIRWITVLPAIALATMVFVVGCGESSSSVSPSEVPSATDYEAEVGDAASFSGEDPGPAATGGEKTGGEEAGSGEPK